MHWRFPSSLLSTLLLIPFAQGQEPAGWRDLQATYRRVIERTEPAIASVRVSRSSDYADKFKQPGGAQPGQLGEFAYDTHLLRSNANDQRLAQRLDLASATAVPDYYGSGVVVGDGLILTNYHVVRDATKIFAKLPGNQGSYCDIHAADARSDLAVLRPIRPLKVRPLPWGDGGKLRKGDFVIGLTYAFAAGVQDGGPSASWGIVSNLRRRIVNPKREQDTHGSLAWFGPFIQTDVKLNLGCSGGALVNFDGELVALTTALAPFTGSDIPGGYALPIDQHFRRIVQTLIEGREVEYGFLGVTLAGFEGGSSVRLAGAYSGSPGERAGLGGGDAIRAVDGVPVTSNDELFLQIGTALAGREVVLDVENHFGTRRVRVRLTKFQFSIPKPAIFSNRPQAVRGLYVDYSSVLIIEGGEKKNSIPTGVVVREVISNSPAANAGLKPFQDVIRSVNGHDVETPDEFYRLAPKTGPLELTLTSGRKVIIP